MLSSPAMGQQVKNSGKRMSFQVYWISPASSLNKLPNFRQQPGAVSAQCTAIHPWVGHIRDLAGAVQSVGFQPRAYWGLEETTSIKTWFFLWNTTEIQLITYLACSQSDMERKVCVRQIGWLHTHLACHCQKECKSHSFNALLSRLSIYQAPWIQHTHTETCSFQKVHRWN